MNCKTCRFYYPDTSRADGIGLCGAELPSFVMLDTLHGSRSVHEMNSCSLHRPKEEEQRKEGM